MIQVNLHEAKAKLSASAKSLLEDSGNTLRLSSASVWEIYWLHRSAV